jgi:hypothetical protein
LDKQLDNLLTHPQVQDIDPDNTATDAEEASSFNQVVMQLADTMGHHSLGYLLKRDMNFALSLAESSWLVRYDTNGVAVVKSDSLVLEEISNSDFDDQERAVNRTLKSNITSSGISVVRSHSFPILMTKISNLVIRSLSFCSSGYQSLYSISKDHGLLLEHGHCSWETSNFNFSGIDMKMYWSNIGPGASLNAPPADSLDKVHEESEQLVAELDRNRHKIQRLTQEVDSSGDPTVSGSFILRELVNSTCVSIGSPGVVEDDVVARSNASLDLDSLNSVGMDLGNDLSYYIPDWTTESTVFPPSTTESGDSWRLASESSNSIHSSVPSTTKSEVATPIPNSNLKCDEPALAKRAADWPCQTWWSADPFSSISPGSERAPIGYHDPSLIPTILVTPPVIVTHHDQQSAHGKVENKKGSAISLRTDNIEASGTTTSLEEVDTCVLDSQSLEVSEEAPHTMKQLEGSEIGDKTGVEGGPLDSGITVGSSCEVNEQLHELPQMEGGPLDSGITVGSSCEVNEYRQQLHELPRGPLDSGIIVGSSCEVNEYLHELPQMEGGPLDSGIIVGSSCKVNEYLHELPQISKECGQQLNTFDCERGVHLDMPMFSVDVQDYTQGCAPPKTPGGISREDDSLVAAPMTTAPLSANNLEKTDIHGLSRSTDVSASSQTSSQLESGLKKLVESYTLLGKGLLQSSASYLDTESSASTALLEQCVSSTNLTQSSSNHATVSKWPTIYLYPPNPPQVIVESCTSTKSRDVESGNVSVNCNGDKRFTLAKNSSSMNSPQFFEECNFEFPSSDMQLATSTSALMPQSAEACSKNNSSVLQQEYTLHSKNSVHDVHFPSQHVNLFEELSFSFSTSKSKLHSRSDNSVVNAEECPSLSMAAATNSVTVTIKDMFHFQPFTPQVVPISLSYSYSTQLMATRSVYCGITWQTDANLSTSLPAALTLSSPELGDLVFSDIASLNSSVLNHDVIPFETYSPTIVLPTCSGYFEVARVGAVSSVNREEKKVESRSYVHRSSISQRFWHRVKKTIAPVLRVCICCVARTT